MRLIGELVSVLSSFFLGVVEVLLGVEWLAGLEEMLVELENLFNGLLGIKNCENRRKRKREVQEAEFDCQQQG